jgi:hypothetical protein
MDFTALPLDVANVEPSYTFTVRGVLSPFFKAVNIGE